MMDVVMMMIIDQHVCGQYLANMPGKLPVAVVQAFKVLGMQLPAA
jgi:hypothetical protein